MTQGFVWECRNDVGRPFWVSPPGFSIKKLVYNTGILFAIGNQSSSGGKKFGGIWAIPLATRSPIFISAPRKHRNSQLTDFSVGCPGPGATIFAGDATSGKVFLYDIERDAISLFDDLANGGTGDGMSFTPYDNLLSFQQASIEIGQTYRHPLYASAVDGWGPEANCTLTRSVTQQYSGLSSLLLTPSPSGTISAITDTGTAGAPVSGSTQYTAGAWFRAQTAARSCNVIIRWYDSSGTIISSSSGSTVSDSTSAWTQATVTDTSPSNAVYAAVAVQVASTSSPADPHYVDAVILRAGASVASAGQKIAFLNLHGTRLFGATYDPLSDGTTTSLQVFSYDDLVIENRDSSQSITGTLETAQWDMGLPMEQKALIGFRVTYEITDAATASGLIANSRIKVEYSLDGAAYATAATITSATSPVGAKGDHFVQLSDGTTTYKFNRLKVRLTLDNNATAGVAPPVLLGVTVEAQPIAYARIWDLAVQVEDEEQNLRPASRAEAGSQIHADLVALATNKDLVTFLDGAWSDQPAIYDTHTVIVESPRSVLGDSIGNGTMALRLRSVLT